MKNPLQIGITGGIGSGKSVVCEVFGLLGVPVYDADSRAKSLMTTDGILMSAIRKEFGVLSYNPDDTLNRAYLAGKVFNDKQQLAKLNQLVHPRVGMDYENWLAAHANFNFVLKEAALIFEAGSDSILDKVIVVHAPVELRIKRVLERDPQRTEEQIRDIIQNQWPEEEKLKRADYVITNDETSLVIPQVLELQDKINALIA